MTSFGVEFQSLRGGLHIFLKRVEPPLPPIDHSGNISKQAISNRHAQLTPFPSTHTHILSQTHPCIPLHSPFLPPSLNIHVPIPTVQSDTQRASLKVHKFDIIFNTQTLFKHRKANNICQASWPLQWSYFYLSWNLNPNKPDF